MCAPRGGHAFLLVHTLDIAANSAATTKGVPTIPGGEVQRTRTPAALAVVIYIVKRKPESTFDWICIGRNDGNDANGMFIGTTRVPRAGDGPPVPLVSGMVLKLGEISATFLDAAALHSMLTR